MFQNYHQKFGIDLPYNIIINFFLAALAVPIIKEIKPEDHSANITWTLPHEKGVRTGFVYYLEYRKQGELNVSSKWHIVTLHLLLPFTPSIFIFFNLIITSLLLVLT